MATLRDVARSAGVSISTVSSVVNRTKYVSPELTRRVEEAIRALNYRPNSLARGLRTNQTHTLGLVMSDITNLYFAELARGVEDRAERDDYTVFLCNTDADPRREAKYVQRLLSQKADGIIFTSVRQDDTTVRRLVEDGIPVVLINRRIPGVETDYVGTDNVRGAARATEYLIALGHTRIGFISGAALSSASADRREGYLQTLVKAGLPVEPELIQEGDLRQREGYAAARRLLSLPNPPTAIFAANDLMALGAMEVAAEMGRQIPEDLSLVGYDDNQIAALPGVQLTTVRQPAYEMGQLAAEILLEKLKADSAKEWVPRHITVRSELVVRRTTAPPRLRKG
ncbi:MAG: LacI family DNA-binding transcriptional regulator [Betaproteobacteria bacterium]